MSTVPRRKKWLPLRPRPAILSAGALGAVSGIEAGLEPNRIAQVEALEARRKRNQKSSSRNLMSL